MKKRNIYITILASIILFGYAYNLDILQALQGPFRQQPFCFTSTSFNLLYFFTFLPSVFLDIPIGILIDKNPLKVSMYTLLIVSLISQICIALALEFMVNNYIWVMYGMRSLFGIAGQGMFTVQGVIVAKYAKSDYEIMMGVCLSLPFLMDSVNSAVTTAVFDATGYMALPWYIGGAVSFLSLLAATVLHSKYLRAKKNKKQTQRIKQRQQQEEQSTSSEELIQQQFHFKALKKFKFQFWVLIGAIFFCQSSLGPFVDNLNDLIVKRFNVSYITTGKLLLIPFGSLLPICLGITILCSKRPHIRRNIILLGTVLYFLAMSLLYMLPNTTDPVFYYYLVIVFFLFTMGFLFSVQYSIIYSCVTYVVEVQNLGTAFGVCGGVIALAQCLIPIANIQIMSQASILVVQNPDFWRKFNTVFQLIKKTHVVSGQTKKPLDLPYCHQIGSQLSAEKGSRSKAFFVTAYLQWLHQAIQLEKIRYHISLILE